MEGGSGPETVGSRLLWFFYDYESTTWVVWGASILPHLGNDLHSLSLQLVFLTC
jgi:hypothetical protein